MTHDQQFFSIDGGSSAGLAPGAIASLVDLDDRLRTEATWVEGA